MTDLEIRIVTYPAIPLADVTPHPRSAGAILRQTDARAVASFSNQSIDETRPILSATLPGDEPIQIVIPPATTKGTVSIMIRKPSSVSLSLDGLDQGGLFVEVAREEADISSVDRRLLEFYRTGSY